MDLTSRSGDVRREVTLGTMAELSAVPEARRWGLAESRRRAHHRAASCSSRRRGTALRAFDVETGTMLWAGDLPASAQATPMKYRSASGKQFVEIAVGGNSAMETKRGDHVVVLTLP